MADPQTHPGRSRAGAPSGYPEVRRQVPEAMMNLNDLPELCEWTQRRTFHPGQTIFLEGDACTMIYQVVRGVVKMLRGSSSGREIIVGLVCPGDFLDVVAILDGRPYGVSTAAVLGTEV